MTNATKKTPRLGTARVGNKDTVFHIEKSGGRSHCGLALLPLESPLGWNLCQKCEKADQTTSATTKTPPVVHCMECGQAFGSDPKELGICGPCAVRLGLVCTCCGLNATTTEADCRSCTDPDVE